MTKIAYMTKNFRPASRAMLEAVREREEEHRELLIQEQDTLREQTSEEEQQ